MLESHRTLLARPTVHFISITGPFFHNRLSQLAQSRRGQSSGATRHGLNDPPNLRNPSALARGFFQWVRRLKYAALERRAHPLGPEILSSEHSPNYRPDIDGLRAIAILAVLAFHAFPTALPGGFIGVDIFFVISGFLITSIILRSLDSDGFSYRDFYARRVKRIFPALALVLVATFAVGWHVLSPSELAQLGKHAAAGAGFVSNFAFWSEAGYFDSAAETKPLLHLWSLAIEEQFYLVWPLLLGLAWNRKRRIFGVVLAVAAVSFAINVAIVQSHQTAAFYSPASRFWELMVGGMLACWRLRGPRARSAALSHAQSAAGLALIVLGLIFIRGGAAFPGWWALLPTLGAFLCIAAGPAGIMNRYLLGARPMVWIGLISYPLYLWHWPLLAYARIIDVGGGEWTVRAAALVLSFVLAYMTFKFLEFPIRKRAWNRVAGSVLVVPMVAVFAFGLGTYMANGFGFRLEGTPLAFASHDYDFKTDSRSGECWASSTDTPDSYAKSCVDPKDGSGKPLVMVWGDSHAGRFAPGLRREVAGKARLAVFARDSCPPIVEFAYPRCVEANSYVLSQVIKIKPDTVVLFGHWAYYLASPSKLSLQDLQSTAAQLKLAGVSRIILMGPAPTWTEPLPKVLVKLHRDGGAIPVRATFKLAEATVEADETMARFAANAGVEYFSTFKAMCNEEGCLTYTVNSPEGLTTWDYGHLTTSGAQYVARQMGSLAVSAPSPRP